MYQDGKSAYEHHERSIKDDDDRFRQDDDQAVTILSPGSNTKQTQGM